MNAQDIIDSLRLEPHPEGGYYRETFRDPEPVGGRSHSTAIYFLLTEGQVSRWHRVDSAEVFHYYSGAALELKTRNERGEIQIQLLGPNLAAGELPQVVIPGHTWQAARPLGAYSLVGCTVSPGFSFSHFEMEMADRI